MKVHFVVLRDPNIMDLWVIIKHFLHKSCVLSHPAAAHQLYVIKIIVINLAICDRICENVHSSHKNLNSFF